jgi:hypothetical protein
MRTVWVPVLLFFAVPPVCCVLILWIALVRAKRRLIRKEMRHEKERDGTHVDPGEGDPGLEGMPGTVSLM